MQLIITHGPDLGRKFQLPGDADYIVGRGDASDTKINDESMSRRHFSILFGSENTTIRDLKSSSGTFVNGKKIEASTIESGAEITAGNTRFRLDAVESRNDETLQLADKKEISSSNMTTLLGTQMGPFELQEVIGKGVSGIVFKAWNKEKNQHAAIKVLSPQISGDEDQKQRFIRAMQTMLPIRDPHIIRLLAAGKTGPYCWAAMDFIDGQNLTQLIEKVGIDGMLDWRDVWRTAMHIGRALQVAYKEKVIHRNVTPTNIIRQHDNRSFLLGDFMLAKALEGDNARQITQPGQLVGDLAYMSPERTHSDGVVDTRSDLYGLGATCYALLTGTAPATGNSLPEIVKNIREKTPPRPKTVHLSVDDLFQDIIMRMLAKSPGDRHQSPGELIVELERIGKFNNLVAN